tara:strand:- start:1436 stop:1660 length:225 start_codon:yes stop_codon:yes gene_type:complete
MPNKIWNDLEVAEIKIMKKTMTTPEIARKKGLRVTQVNYVLYYYVMKEQATIKPVEVGELGKLKKKTFWQWLTG